MAQRHKPIIRATIRPLLGTMADADVAAQCDISQSTIQHWRTQAQIAPYRLHSAIGQRYRALFRQHPEGLTAQQVTAALGITRQGVSLMLHALARRGVIECVARPNPRRYGGRETLLAWHLTASSKENTHHAQTD